MEILALFEKKLFFHSFSHHDDDDVLPHLSHGDDVPHCSLHARDQRRWVSAEYAIQKDVNYITAPINSAQSPVLKTVPSSVCRPSPIPHHLPHLSFAHLPCRVVRLHSRIVRILTASVHYFNLLIPWRKRFQKLTTDTDLDYFHSVKHIRTPHQNLNFAEEWSQLSRTKRTP